MNGALAHLVAETLLDPVFLKAIGIIGPYDRSCLLVAMKNSLALLRKRKPCDVCRMESDTMRFFVADPDEMNVEGVSRHLFVFSLLCRKCAGLPRNKVVAAISQRVKRIVQEGGSMDSFGSRPVTVGVPVGEVGNLSMPKRTALDTCADCGKTVWTNEDQRPAVTGNERQPKTMCIDCLSLYADKVSIGPVIDL